MTIAAFSVHRPVLITMLTLVVLLLGAVALVRLPVDLMPDITDPTLSVSTGYEDASPEIVEELVTRPIEEAMSAVPGVKEVTSTSSEGNSNVRVTFAWGTDLDAAASDIRDRLDRVVARLPDDADRPTLRKFDLASFPILVLGAASRMDPVQMRQVIDDEVKYRLERVPGVAAVDVRGGLEREIHVDVDPAKLKALGIQLDQVVERIGSANAMLPAGQVDAGPYEISVRTPGEYASLDELRQTVVAVRDGVSVRLGDFATVEDSSPRLRRVVRVNGLPGIRLAVNKQSGANTVEVAERVRDEMRRINEDMPHLRLVALMDTSDYIRRSITNAGTSAMYGGLFAILVLLLFLRSLRSTLIIAVAIPTSIVATFMLLYFGDLTLNLMTLGGLALGVGMLVDNSIVVLENIYRLRESHGDPRAAAVSGAQEVTAAIIASTLTTVVVFLPLVFVRGMSGIMFRQLAYVICFALLCSLVSALTLVPMLASRFLHFGGEGAPRAGVPMAGAARRLSLAIGARIGRLEEAYKRTLRRVLGRRLTVVAVAFALLAASLTLMPLIGTEFMPASDEGEVRVDLEMDVGTRVGALDAAARPVEAIVAREVPEGRRTIVNLGGSGFGGGGGGHAGDIQVALAPQAERRRSSEQVAAALRPTLAGIPGLQVRTRAGQGLFLLRRFSGGTERVQVEIRGYDLETADEIARQASRIIEGVRGVTDVQVSRKSGAPEELIIVDRAKAEALHLTVRQVGEALQTALSGSTAGQYREAGKEYPIRVRLKDAETRPVRDVLDLALTGPGGAPVVLRNVVRAEPRSGPVQIERKDQERMVSLRANIYGRDMGSIMADIARALRALPLPRGFSIGFGGDYEEQQKAFRELALGLGLALILVYMVMACLYESLRDPFVVMFSVPLAVIGVVLMLVLTGTTFNVQTYIGCIMLGGIVVNNAILLVDTTNRLHREAGLPLREAIEEAGRRRLRPILMTALTTGCALVPLATGWGEGGETQAPLARAVVGGLASSTLITLFLVPVVYSLFEEGRRWGRKARGAERVAEEAAP